MFAGVSVFAQETKPTPAPGSLVGQKYTCVMHPDVVRDRPGICPKCGMKLVAMKTHEHSQTHHDAAHHPQDSGHHHSNKSERPMEQMSMASSINLAEPMTRESSGTAWAPDSTPTYGKMFMFG